MPGGVERRHRPLIFGMPRSDQKQVPQSEVLAAGGAIGSRERPIALSGQRLENTLVAAAFRMPQVLHDDAAVVGERRLPSLKIIVQRVRRHLGQVRVRHDDIVLLGQWLIEPPPWEQTRAKPTIERHQQGAVLRHRRVRRWKPANPNSRLGLHRRVPEAFAVAIGSNRRLHDVQRLGDLDEVAALDRRVVAHEQVHQAVARADLQHPRPRPNAPKLGVGDILRD